MSAARTGLLTALRSEVPAYSDRPYRFRDLLVLLLSDGGFQADFFYRVSHHFVNRSGRYGLLMRMFTSFGRVITSSSIDPRAQIGPRCYIAYGLGIVIGSHARIGEDCRIFSGASVASARPGMAEIKQPRIGNRVLIGAGAKVLGDIELGDDCVIGANAVVVHSFGAQQVLVGIPARPLAKKG